MSAPWTMLAAAGMALASVGAHRALFTRNRRPDLAQPTVDELIQACEVVSNRQAPPMRVWRRHWMPLPQTDESRRWHLERAEARRIRRAYRKMRLDIDSRLDNPAWPHPATGRSA
jgi:hypothetical protein